MKMSVYIIGLYRSLMKFKGNANQKKDTIIIRSVRFYDFIHNYESIDYYFIDKIKGKIILTRTKSRILNR